MATAAAGALGTVAVLRRYPVKSMAGEALDHAPPGINDPRSWAYWNSRLGRYPTPPAPARRLG